MRPMYALASLGALALAAPLAAQQQSPRLFLEARGGAVVPTFDIADVADTGGALGATIGVHLSPRWTLFGEFDYAMHNDKATGSIDITTLHYMAKVGYSLTGWRERGWNVLVNLGLGAVGFDVEGAPETSTYFAINAGAKVSYAFNRTFSLVLSPQGDIAFSDEDELGSSTAWVWPFTAGLRVSF